MFYREVTSTRKRQKETKLDYQLSMANVKYQKVNVGAMFITSFMETQTERGTLELRTEYSKTLLFRAKMGLQ